MPASRTPSDRPERVSARPPAVPRPRGAVLDAIEREGVSWEGQVLIVGHDGDIPAVLFITSDRLLLTSRDTTLLEVPRTWLVPAPLRVQESGVRFSITPEGVVPGRATTERLLLMIVEGRGPAAQLIAILTGRARRQQIEAEFPTWKAGVGAGRASALPPLPAFETSRDTPRPTRRDTADAEARGVAPIDEWEPAEEQPARPHIPFHAPEPEPVQPQSRAARFITTREPNRAAVAVAPEAETPVNVTPIEPERRKRHAGWGTWSSRVAMIAIIALVAGWFARPYLPDEVTDRLPAAIMDETPEDVALSPSDGSGNDSSASEGDGTNGAGANPTDIMPTEAALGVGGATSAIPDAVETEPPTGDQGEGSGEELVEAPPASGEQPAQAEQGEPPADTGEGDPGEPPAAPDPTEAPVDAEPTQEPVATEPPVVVEPQEPIATETPVVADPTQEPVVETPVATELPATEVPATEPPVSTVAPVTETPVTVPPVTATAEATEPVEATEPPTEEPVDGEPTLEPQAPSVNPEEPPAQEFVDSGIRYSVDGATTGSSVPELPEIAEVSYGEWIVLAVDAQNVTSQEQVFDMREFTLLADGQPIQVDVGNSWVASMMGYTPAYGNTDAILWAPGEQHQFVLTFLAPTDAQSLVLQAGEQQFDLSAALATTPALGEMRQGTAPETIDATVVEVIDGETIVIEKDGLQQTVRYLGVDVPGEGDCYTVESTEANRALVEGRNVKIERQATDVDAQGNWVRDVWVETDDGTYVLVAHQLVQNGAATADISEPNTRFASWLRGAEAVAQAEGLGLWGACEQGLAAPVTVPIALLPETAIR
jgi:endonuclease YncB( thermonuclease family)